MLSQIVLTPTESKKLIARAIVQMKVVKEAADNGLIAIHPSSSTYFITEELLGTGPPSNIWVCGVIAPKAACVEMGATSRRVASGQSGETDQPSSPGEFKHTYLIRQGQFSTDVPLDQILEEMGPGDIYIKGVNALDPKGKVAVLVGNRVEGGTIARVLAAQRRKGFTIVWPAGLEKLIPVPVEEAARVASRTRYGYSMGLPCSLVIGDGEVITEINAVQILSGATAVPISAGGLGGAEGAVTLVVQGNEEDVTKIIRIAEQCKGAALPQVRLNSCHDCPVTHCFSVKDKPWAAT